MGWLENAEIALVTWIPCLKWRVTPLESEDVT